MKKTREQKLKEEKHICVCTKAICEECNCRIDLINFGSRIIQSEKKRILEWLKRKCKYYDKISKKELSQKIINRRIKANLSNTFFIIIHSEDFIREFK